MTAFVILLLIIALLIQQHSKKGDLSFLEGRASSSMATVEPDEEFAIVCDLFNKSFRFLPFLKLRIFVPQEMTFPHLKKGVINSGANGVNELILTTWMLPKQKLNIRIPCTLEKRGRYFTNGMTISCGDFFGLSEMATRYDDFIEIVCLPKTADSKLALSTAGGFPGDISVNRFIFEDPVLTIGFREYTGKEPMKQISWLQSARMGKLVVKEMDHTLETSVTVVLNIETGKDRTEQIENAYSMARYVCRQLEEKRMTYSFMTNAVTAGSIKSFRYVGEGLGKNHLGYILEGLGRGTYVTSVSCRTLLSDAVKRSSGSYGLIFITAGDENGQCGEASKQAARAGLGITCINCGGDIQ